MKISYGLYIELQAAIAPIMAKIPKPDTVPAMRYRWDLLWASHFPVNRLYAAGLNDNHIDTALRNIVG
mgnify:CR=1 FL=1